MSIFEIQDNTLLLSGALNEATDYNALTSLFKEFCKDQQGVEIRADFSSVERANSYGLFKWIKVCDEFLANVTYVNCPVWLVEQFNMINEFFTRNCSVESFQARFYSETNDRLELATLHLGQEVPILKDYETFKLDLRDASNQPLTPDFDIPSYFMFITANYQKLIGK